MPPLDNPPAQSDRYAACARPTFVYVIVAVLAVDYIVLPLAKLFGSHVEPVELPGNLLTLFGVALTGYSVSRSAEKIAALPGESHISVLGLKVANKPCDEASR